MPWIARSLDQISARVRGSFREWLPGTDTSLANNFVTVASKVLAALGFEYELRQAYLSKQMFIRTATGAWLEQHCADIGIYRKQASAAIGRIVGEGLPNTVYPAGIAFSAGSVQYTSKKPATSDGSGLVTIRVAADGKGVAGNRDAAAPLSLADPILWPGLGTSWLVDDDGLGGGAEKEDDDSLRRRGLQRKRNPPRGGALSDYERIARGVPGVVEAWAYRRPDAPGFISVLFLFEGRVNLIPIEADVTAVQAAIDAKRLIRVDDSVAVAPVAWPVDIDITGLSANTAEVQAGIGAAIKAMFLDRCQPGITGDPFVLSRSWIGEAISGVTGENRHVLVSPASDIVLTGGQFPVLGSTSYA